MPLRYQLLGFVDIGNLDLAELKMLETIWKRRFKREEYIALSHFWGSSTDDEKKRFCTAKENYQDLLTGFSINTLPRTLQDALRVTRALERNTFGLMLFA